MKYAYENTGGDDPYLFEPLRFPIFDGMEIDSVDEGIPRMIKFDADVNIWESMISSYKHGKLNTYF